MILLFPDLDTLRLALTSGTVPTDVTLAPAAVSFDAAGRPYVEPSITLSKTTAKILDRLGVKGSKRHATDVPEEVASWVQILPVVKEAGTPNLSSQAAVLFELSSADDLPALAAEMLRLGNDRQGFRWFAAPDEPDGRRVLLRVIGPPYYTLLRAIDKSAAGTTGEVRAYLERAPRVWVEIGHAHPLAAQVRVADDQQVLIRAPREWLFLDDAPFHDVYDILQFQLPTTAVGLAEADAPGKITVLLRLASGNAADVPELWVLRDAAVEQLDALVRDADDRLIQRLMFAVATSPAGTRTVVLRTRPSKFPPPALPLEHALGFKPYWKLPNLFLPAGKRLHPPLRRDAVRRLLADDPDQVVWLYPDAAGGFTPESVPDAAFRSLEDWVDYVIETERAPLAAWIEATRFDFDHFACAEGGGPKVKPDKDDKEPRAKGDGEETGSKTATTAKAASKSKSAARPAGAAEYVPPPAETRPPGEWKVRLKELEDRFLAVDGPLDAPERRALWPELAAANAGLGDASGEAAICWLNALWDADPPPAEWLAGWVRSESPAASPAMKADEFDRKLSSPSSSLNAPRATVASFLWLAHQSPVPNWLPARLPAVQKYLEKHEATLPVRAVWLAAFRLAQLAGADVLGLARVRDRLLLRLLNEGLSTERDLPGFLRFAGLRDSERMRAVREKSQHLHQAVRTWLQSAADLQKNESLRQNLHFADLFFAFAFAKLGETIPTRKLLDDARRVMDRPVPPPANSPYDPAVTAAVVRNFLFRAFGYRVEQAALGKPHAGQMPADLVAALNEIGTKGGSGPANNPYKLAEYAIARMREQSRILEPQEKLDPYAVITKQGDALKKELYDLQAVRDPAKLTDRIRRLFREASQGGGKPADVQFLILHETLQLAPRVGEAFTVELLNLVPASLAAHAPPLASPEATTEPSDTPKKQAELLERALFLAGHYDRPDIVRKLVAQFSDMLHKKKEEARFKLINVVAGQCLRNLKKLGLRDEIDRFLSRLQGEVLQGSSLPDLRVKYAEKPETWGTVLQTLLNLAAGWLSYGLTEQATPILDAARNELLGAAGSKLPSKDYSELAQVYVTALGQGPADGGLVRMTELFTRMDPKKITNTWTTAPYYSRLHLNVIEKTVLALLSDDFALGPAGRRWLDDDEFLVRRRIHADMRRDLDRSGL